MPKALFSVGTHDALIHDALIDDSLFMHARWVAVGNESGIEVLPGGVHGLAGYPTSLGRQAIGRENAFLEAFND